MALLNDSERDFATAVSRLAYVNPFLPERIEWERRAIGEEHVPFGGVWHAGGDPGGQNPNEGRIAARSEALAGELRERLAGGGRARAATAEELELYQDLVLYLLYYRYQAQLYEAVVAGARGRKPDLGFYADFAADGERFLAPAAGRLRSRFEPAHLFACCFQVRRAFHSIFSSILGGSMPAARLRAQVWQSIFTHDLRRYQRSLYLCLGDVTTLVTGPSGTGKELVARAIALSRYIPFDPGTRGFAERPDESFFPLNLSALSPTLIESELFGHRRGAFTGAMVERAGWLEVCPPLGTVFLDEIGEVDVAIQIKLLRVLETRTFQRLGDTRDLRFRGKVVAATHRDLAGEMAAGRFREDLYYRLCSDRIETPSLAERLRDSPQEISDLVLFLAQRQVGEEAAPDLAREVVAWIDRRLGRDYPWPGNVRELAQCVSNVLIRREYLPVPRISASDPRRALAEEILAGRLSAEEVLGRYCTLVYAETGSYQETARRVGLDRRTVKTRVDPELLARLQGALSRPPKH
ncbi:MAG TPA: sigma 54-interacting transcriptional regulator [Thermoanaerobaculia bacterium]|nr:sigma 54-interacting transcriptional regulator [Thermoanaerobaculia bacterium]